MGGLDSSTLSFYCANSSEEIFTRDLKAQEVHDLDMDSTHVSLHRLGFCFEVSKPLQTGCLHNVQIFLVSLGHSVCSVVEAEIPLGRVDVAILFDLFHTPVSELLIPNVPTYLEDGIDPLLADVKSPVVLSTVLFAESSQKLAVF